MIKSRNRALYKDTNFPYHTYNIIYNTMKISNDNYFKMWLEQFYLRVPDIEAERYCKRYDLEDLEKIAENEDPQQYELEEVINHFLDRPSLKVWEVNEEVGDEEEDKYQFEINMRLEQIKEIIDSIEVDCGLETEEFPNNQNPLFIGNYFRKKICELFGTDQFPINLQGGVYSKRTRGIFPSIYYLLLAWIDFYESQGVSEIMFKDGRENFWNCFKNDDLNS